MLTPVAFVLLDPNNPIMDEEAEEINIFPNPAGSSQTISIDLLKAGNVKVELIDADGKSYDVLCQGNLSEGLNYIDIDLTGLQGQQYFYKITTPSGSETKRVLLKN